MTDDARYPFSANPSGPKCAFNQHHRMTCQLPPRDDTLYLECGRCHARWFMRTADAEKAST
jgi:hypothetical protein